MDPKSGIEGAAAAARGAERKAAPWIERLARLGYAAKGIVYVLIGYIATRAAFGNGDVEGGTGAIGSLRDEPMGALLLWLIALGLFGYVLWRAVSAIRNPENDGVGKRAFHGVSAVVYAALALEAIRFASGSGGGGETHWTSTLLEQPLGRLLAALAGLAIAGYGLQQLWSAWTADLDDQLDLSRVSAAQRTWIVRSGRFGLAARGVVLTMLGYIFLRTALEAQPTQAGDVEGVLESLRDQPWMLVVIALGFIAYGAYNLVRARYRRIRAA